MLTELLFDLAYRYPAQAALVTIVAILLIGTIAQIVAERFRQPATAPLLIAGMLFGPAYIGLIHPELLGPGYRVIIRAAVAVCIFEGGLMLDLGAVRQTTRAVLGLVTAGLLITAALAAALTYFILNWTLDMALLFGAIVSVTGPTVITPILNRVRVNDRVRTTLQSESVIADPLGVILAALVFTAITSPGGITHGLSYAVRALGIGVLAGAGTAGVVWLADGRLRLLPSKFARLVILGAALVAYSIAEMLSHETGVLAAAVAGITLGSLDFAHKREVEEFKGDIASMAISAVFILLAARIRPADMATIGTDEIIVVLLLMLVVRPVAVFVSTFRSELRTNEKAFVSSLGPRGIVASSVAMFFSIELIDMGFVGAGRDLVVLVFAVVLGTILIQGTAAGWLARFFKVMRQHTILIGSNEPSRILARSLAAQGESVAIIDNDERACSEASSLSGVRVIYGDATEVSVLRRAGAEGAKSLIAMTVSDKVNLLVCQVARASLEIPRIVAVVASDSHRDAFAAASIEVLSAPHATAAAVEEVIRAGADTAPAPSAV